MGGSFARRLVAVQAYGRDGERTKKNKTNHFGGKRSFPTLTSIKKTFLFFGPTKRPKARCFLEAPRLGLCRSTIERRNSAEGFFGRIVRSAARRRTSVRQRRRTDEEKQNQSYWRKTQFSNLDINKKDLFCFSVLPKDHRHGQLSQLWNTAVTSSSSVNLSSIFCIFSTSSSLVSST